MFYINNIHNKYHVLQLCISSVQTTNQVTKFKPKMFLLKYMQNKLFKKFWKPTSIIPKPVLCCVKINAFNNVDNTNIRIKSNAPLFGLKSFKVWKKGFSVLGLNVNKITQVSLLFSWLRNLQLKDILLEYHYHF